MLVETPERAAGHASGVSVQLGYSGPLTNFYLRLTPVEGGDLAVGSGAATSTRNA